MASLDIFDRLKADHEKHRALIDQIKQTAGNSLERAEYFEAFKLDATAHASAEEETLYSTIMAISDLRHDAQHSVSEHKELSELFIELTDMAKASGGWLNKFNKLAEVYLHHIDEEEKDKFPKAKEEISADKAIELRAEFNARKPDERARAEAGTDEKEIRKELSEGE